MKAKVPAVNTLRFTELPDGVVIQCRPVSPVSGALTGLLLLAGIVGMAWQAFATDEGGSWLGFCGGTFFLVLVFGIIPFACLHSQRLKLSDEGLESRLTFLGVPVWRSFVAMRDIQSLDSVWGGSEDGGGMRLLIRTPGREIQWGVRAEDDEVISLARRLNGSLKRFRAS